jgi:DNA-directed RNA polymerase subunit RPC12/RpoP
MPDEQDGVLTRVCLTCGQEYYFTNTAPPPTMICEKCGSTVFREFYTPLEADEVERDYLESTDRDLDPDDAEGDALPGDVLDLNRD